MLFVLIYFGTIIGIFVLTAILKHTNLVGPYDKVGGIETDLVHKELRRQTKILERERTDRMTGWRQNYKKWN